MVTLKKFVDPLPIPADLLVDFAYLNGKSFLLRNDAPSPFPNGTPVDPETTGQIMEIRVVLPLKEEDRSSPVPAGRGATAGPGFGQGPAESELGRDPGSVWTLAFPAGRERVA